MNKIGPDLFDIDLNRLDKEWVEQPKLYYKFATELPLAKRQLDEAKAKLDVARADWDKKIRTSPGKYSLPEKTTEIMISNTIILQDDVKHLTQLCIDYQYTINMIQAVLMSLEHRKSALERLVSLHGQNYFSTPKINIDSGGVAQILANQKIIKKRD